jgi:hypothetical protein
MTPNISIPRQIPKQNVLKSQISSLECNFITEENHSQNGEEILPEIPKRRRGRPRKQTPKPSEKLYETYKTPEN